jgi:hypothetical protein
MMVFAIWIEHPLDMPVERLHHSHPREHQPAAAAF